MHVALFHRISDNILPQMKTRNSYPLITNVKAKLVTGLKVGFQFWKHFDIEHYPKVYNNRIYKNTELSKSHVFIALEKQNHENNLFQNRALPIYISYEMCVVSLQKHSQILSNLVYKQSLGPGVLF